MCVGSSSPPAIRQQTLPLRAFLCLKHQGNQFGIPAIMFISSANMTELFNFLWLYFVPKLKI
jgi:hypothetical protein